MAIHNGSSSSSHRTLFAHEPLPPTHTPSSFLHIQGAFTPKQQRDDNDDNPSSSSRKELVCICSSPSYIRQMTIHQLQQLLPKIGMTSSNLSTVQVEDDDGGGGISKVRVYTDHPLTARRLACRLKRRQFTPLDLLCGNNNNDDCGCCKECGARYGKRPLQITHVVTTTACTADSEEVRWARAAPPKFQRIINADDVEVRRANTRFVYVENVGGWDVHFDDCDNKMNINDSTADVELKTRVLEQMKHCISSILNGDAAPLMNVMNAKHDMANTTHTAPMNNNHLVTSCADVQDDMHQSFQEGIRRSLLSKHDSSSRGIELFMKSDSSTTKKKMKGDHHPAVGAAIQIEIHLPKTFLSLFDDTFETLHNTQQQQHDDDDTIHYSTTKIQATVTMKKLFLDYADILLPKRIRSTNNSHNNNNSLDGKGGLPSRSECTSTTSQIHIPGLHLLPNYITRSEEQVLLSVLTGPNAPWAPRQYTPSGGVIKRRVQHYGYVFDYESGDVLRREDSNNNTICEEKCDEYERSRFRSSSSCCPPLPT
eukprot:scaffold82142_cov43-Cyclotella_meneghiniana.AAC.1